jgi:hypothetical protein
LGSAHATGEPPAHGHRPCYAPRIANLRSLLAALLCTGALVVLPSVAHAATPQTVWLCRPGLSPDPCTPSLTTTRLTPSGQRLGVDQVKATPNPNVDCFYVYPTVSDQKTPLANLQIDPEERSVALYQVARYSQYCRVFAPMYRQLTLAGIGGQVSAADAAVAYGDVRDAWLTYLKDFNHGRGVVLIGHSQGSFVLRQLIASEIDPKPAVRKRLVSAVLLGGNVTVPAGQSVGGDFQHVPACRSRTQVGCVVAFSTFDQPPPPNTKFGHTGTPGREVLCTNPAALSGGSGSLDPIFPTEPFAPGTTIATGIRLLGPSPVASTPWVEVPGSYTASCSSTGGANVLEIAPVGGAPTLHPSPDPSWGLHLVDANIALGNLVALVHTEATAYAKGTAQSSGS